MKRIASVLLLLLVTACRDSTTIVIPTSPSGTPTNPGAPVPPAAVNTVQFRVTGNPTSARIRHSNNLDGLTQIVTTLPYTSQFTTTQQDLFLSLDATPTAYSFLTMYPFLAVQIFVNGQLFREASASDYLLNTLSVSGSWRR